MSTLSGFGFFGSPQVVRFARYAADGALVGEIPHVEGEFVEPVTLKAGEMIVVLLPDEQRVKVAYREPLTLDGGAVGALGLAAGGGCLAARLVAR